MDAIGLVWSGWGRLGRYEVEGAVQWGHVRCSGVQLSRVRCGGVWQVRLGPTRCRWVIKWLGWAGMVRFSQQGCCGFRCSTVERGRAGVVGCDAIRRMMIRQVRFGRIGSWGKVGYGRFGTVTVGPNLVRCRIAGYGMAGLATPRWVQCVSALPDNAGQV